jgi:hypothetical protein
MDLQEQTRRDDVYNDINQIVDNVGALKVFPSLVWVWVWDVIKNMKDTNPDVTPYGPAQDYAFVGDLKDVFNALWDQVDSTGFTLEYGVDDLDEAIRDWLIENNFLLSLDDDGWLDDEEEDDILDDVLADDQEEIQNADE